ncbi:MAG: LegC family aminotransferase [Bdellovibrionota bacterium]
MSEFIPLSVPHIRAGEMAYVKECLESEWVSSAGPFVDKFEKEFAAYVGAPYAVACASGTAALHVSLLLAGVKPGDLVLVPTLTFIASVNAVHYCGAEPFFFDCDEHYNIDPAQVTLFLRQDCEKRGDGLFHRNSGKRVAAILPVHIFGNAVNLEPLLEAAEEFSVPVVEDAAESLGTRYLPKSGRRTGGKHTGTLGLLGCFSFNGNKIITTGGGGMLVTSSETLARRAKYLTTQAKDDEARFVHHEIGFNYRLTNVQAAIGLGQLETMVKCKSRKAQIFISYQKGLAGVPGLRMGSLPEYAENNLWMPCLQIDAEEYGEDREELMQRLGAAKIQARPVWELNHRQRPYREFGRMPTERAERLHRITLNIPCSVGLSGEDQARVVEELRDGR